MTEIREIKVSDLKPDENNANLGTERGGYALEKSLQDYGAGRSILIDKHGEIIAGNKTLAKSGELGIEDVIVVQTDGKKIVAVQRMDLDLNDGPAARMLAYADNRVGELSLDWNMEQIAMDVDYFDFSDFWHDWELGLGDEPPSLDELLDEHGEPGERDFWPFIRVQVSPDTYQEFHDLMERISAEDDDQKIKTIIGMIDDTLLGGG